MLTGFTDGVNAFAEANEFGKSTLLAAIRGVLFERYVSRADSVKEMRHRTNSTFPVVALDGTIHHDDAAEVGTRLGLLVAVDRIELSTYGL